MLPDACSGVLLARERRYPVTIERRRYVEIMRPRPLTVHLGLDAFLSPDALQL